MWNVSTIYDNVQIHKYYECHIELTGDKGLSVYDGELVVHDVLLTFGSNKGSGCPETTNLASADTLAIEVTEQTNLKFQVIEIDV